MARPPWPATQQLHKPAYKNGVAKLWKSPRCLVLVLKISIKIALKRKKAPAAAKTTCSAGQGRFNKLPGPETNPTTMAAQPKPTKTPAKRRGLETSQSRSGTMPPETPAKKAREEAALSHSNIIDPTATPTAEVKAAAAT
jgi:hypothetical protein